MKMKFLKEIKFDKNGLVPAIIQDYTTNKVLMLGYMNKEALLMTIRTKRTTFYSRSRKKIWVKGETSGNFQRVKQIYLDCDGDVILIRVIQIGKGACHKGYYTCFFRKLTNKEKFKVVLKRRFNPKNVYKK